MLTEIILAHAIGDYIIQNSWMANEKVKRWWPAVVHGATYTIPFLFITTSLWALLVIFSTHVIIDHWRLAKYFVWARNQVAPADHRYREVGDTGHPADTPLFLGVWLMIIADNIFHIIINIAAVHYL
jgi:hypothetical protein